MDSPCPNESPLSLEISALFPGHWVPYTRIRLVFPSQIGVSQSLFVAALQLNGEGWIFVVKKGVGGFAEGGRKGEERVRR